MTPGRELGIRWASWTTRRRRPILVGAALAAIVTGALASRLHLRGDLAALLPPGVRSVVDLQQLEARAPLHGTILVAIESDDARLREQAARQIEARLRGLAGGAIVQVDADSAVRDRFAWAHRYLLAPTADLEAVRDELSALKARANPLYVAVDDGPSEQPATRLRELKRRLDEVEAGARQARPLLSLDGRVQLVVARTRHPADDVDDNAAALATARAAVDEARRLVGPAVRLGVAGDVITSAEEHRALSGGMLLSTLLTTAVVAVGLWLFFGAALPVAGLLGALTLGALVTFAFAFLAVGHLNMATAFLAPIVVGNGINFGIILLARYAEERRQIDGAGAVEALGRAVTGSFGGTLAAALAASVSYASLLATQFRGFRHFGVIGGVGILCCWAATFLVLPAALAALETRGWFTTRRGLVVASDGAWLSRMVSRRRPLLMVSVGALVAVAAAGAAGYLGRRPFETDFKNLRSSGAAIREIQAWSAVVDAGFGRGLSGATVIALPSEARAREVAAQLRAVDADQPETARLFARVSSFDELVPPDQDAKLALLNDIRRLLTPATLASLSEADRALATAIAPPLDVHPIRAADVPAALAWPFTEANGTRGRLLIVRTGAGFDLWRTEDLHRFVARFRALPLGPDVVVGGNAFVKDDIVSSVDRDGPRATLIAALGAVVVVLIVLGVSRAAAVTLIAGGTGVLAMLAMAGLLGIRINFLDFVALPITIGIGVDYAVNIAARQRREGAGSAGRILSTTGPAVAVCSFTTVVGYGSLLLSDNRGIRSFGLSALVGELTCVAAALILAPLLLEILPTAAEVSPATRPGSADGVRGTGPATAGLEVVRGA